MGDEIARRKTQAEPDPASGPSEVFVAAGLVMLQAIGLLVIAAVLTVKTATGRPDSLGRSLFGICFAVGAAAILVLATRGLLAGRRAARAPIFVLELLAIPVAYSLAFQAHRYGYGLPILLSAAIAIAVMFSPRANKFLDAS